MKKTGKFKNLQLKVDWVQEYKEMISHYGHCCYEKLYESYKTMYLNASGCDILLHFILEIH